MHDHPARVLAAYAGRADLVVVGRHGGGPPAIGGIQHAVLSHAHGPIAIVPDLAVVSDTQSPRTRPLSWARSDVSKDRLTP